MYTAAVGDSITNVLEGVVFLPLVAHVDVGHHRQIDHCAAGHRHEHRAQVNLIPAACSLPSRSRSRTGKKKYHVSVLEDDRQTNASRKGHTGKEIGHVLQTSVGQQARTEM
jgi:hypothetical protein